MTFDDFGLTQAIRQAVEDLGFDVPTPVQTQVIPFLMKNDRDLIALAQTGTGKTAAYGLPILHRTDAANRTTQTLILCPTRELCMQITRDLHNFAKHIHGLSIVAIYGGAPIDTQARALAKGVQIIVATPGRMHDMIRRGRAKLSAVRHVILDEADEMLNMGFQEDLEAILKTVPEGVRTLLFSATMPGPVAAIAGRYMHSPEEITVGERNAGSETVRHEYYMVHARDRYAALKRILDMAPSMYGIVFCRTRAETQELAVKLMADGYTADALHGDLSQIQRDRVMDAFRTRILQILVATDVAARGLDVTDLTHVINYSLPDEAGQYTHRSGRTGRAGKAGVSVLIINMREAHKIGILERIVKKRFQHKPVPSGRDVCAAQLHGMLERVRRVEVNEAAMAPYLGQIRTLLTELPAEEVLKRFVSIEFNRFLAYYKDAADLNVSPSTERSDRSARGGAQSRRTAPMTGLSINLGRRNGLTPPDLIGLVNRAARGPAFDIGRIEIGNDRSRFEVAGGDVRILTQSTGLPTFGGRRVRIELLQTGDSAPSQTHSRPKPHNHRGAARLPHAAK